MARSPAKVSVECPHCGFKQLEYAAARSTLCRQCGKHFVVTPVDVAAKPGAVKEEALAGPSFRQRFEGLWNRPRVTSVVCYDCGTRQEITSAATSTICPSCSVHMDLRDYKITGSFSRLIRTHGEVHITSTGDVSSSQVTCRTAIIDGKLRGSLHCHERAEFRAAGKMQGKLVAPTVLIGKKANVQFFRQLQVGSIEIRGAMTGEIVAATVMTIRSGGSLDGNVIARSINVEKGGTFTGQLVIGQPKLEQAELLPDFGEPSAPEKDSALLRSAAPFARDLLAVGEKRAPFPRSPYERLGNYVHLPRLIDKARLHYQGLLNGYNYKTVGFDKHLLGFLKIDPDAFEKAVNELGNDEAVLVWIRARAASHEPEEIEQWNEAMITRRPDTAVKQARFSHFLKEAGGEGRTDIGTYFDLIEFDEGRLA